MKRADLGFPTPTCEDILSFLTSRIQMVRMEGKVSLKRGQLKNITGLLSQPQIIYLKAATHVVISKIVKNLYKQHCELR